jgi:hypothetical protein
MRGMGEDRVPKQVATDACRGLPTHGDAAAVASVPAGASPFATSVRAERRRTNGDAKCRFYPWRACETTRTATAQYCLDEHPHTSTYTQSLIFGSREKQAHGSVTARVYHQWRWSAKGTDGSDHVSSAKNRSDGQDRTI